VDVLALGQHESGWRYTEVRLSIAVPLAP
jgi:hypothetical protein